MSVEKQLAIDNPDVLAHYDLLDRIGVIKEINRLYKKLRQSTEIIDEAASIFSQHSIDSLMDHVISFFMDKFTPLYLVLILKDRTHMTSPSVLCFQNLKQVEPPIDIDDFEPFYKFFSANPNKIRYTDFQKLARDSGFADQLQPLSPEHVFPLMGIDGVFGLLVFGRKIVDNEYSEEEIGYIEDLVTFASISLQNIINYADAITDYKTGLYNHSFFLRRVEEERANARRYNKELALLLIDIDFFKKLNDTFGHLAGDEVLVRIADILRQVIRAGDIVSRFGGEEFAVLLAEADVESAKATAERIRTAIETTSVEYLGKELSVTVSIGVRTVAEDDEAAVETIIHQADLALYQAKSEGRNRVCLFRG